MSTVFVPLIEGFWIRNYKCLKQIAFGSSFYQSVVADIDNTLLPYELTPLTIFIGASGTGKSTILDAFSFICDCINSSLDEAIQKRGGFDEIYHRNGEGPISFGLIFRACSEPKPLTYVVNISKKQGTNHTFIETEAILYRDVYQSGATQPILLFQNGTKTSRHITSWHNADTVEIERIKRTDQKHLALKELAKFDDLLDVPQLKYHLDRFHYACYLPENAAGLTPTRFKLPNKGESLQATLKRIKEKHHFEFHTILEIIARQLPEVEKITYDSDEMGRMILSFLQTGQTHPFHANQVSEGLLRLFSHLFLFEDPMPTPLVGVEEPAAYMDEEQIKSFAKASRTFVREKGGTQFLMTTNQTMLVDQMDPTEVWILFRDTYGNIKSTRGLDELSFQGIDLNTIGPYWYSDYIYHKSF